MKPSLIALMLISLLYSCSNNKMAGKIENRQGQYYLVNTSKNKVYQFTVKRTTLVKDSVIEYKTFTKILAPGEEIGLGPQKDTLNDPLQILEETPPTVYDATVTGELEITNISKYLSEKDKIK